MKAWQSWTLLTCVALALILVPFAIWEEPMSAWSARLLAPGAARTALGASIVLVLSLDVLLPIPSSFVSASAVALLGALAGGLAVALGMTGAAWLGYALGRFGGEPLALRLAGRAELDRAQRMMDRYGSVVLLACRGVPVLAEASTLFAGVTRMSRLRFGLVTALGNVGLACAYAAIALLGLDGTPAFLAPFVLGLLVPGLALLLIRPLASR